MAISIRSVLIALAGSILLSSISILLSTYALALKSTGSLPSQSLPLVSRSLILLLAISLVSLLRVSCFSPRPYLTIYDLYMRFAPFSSFIKSIMSKVLLLVSLPRVLLPMILKDLFNRFVPKASAILLNLSLTAKIPPAP